MSKVENESVNTRIMRKLKRDKKASMLSTILFCDNYQQRRIDEIEQARHCNQHRDRMTQIACFYCIHIHFISRLKTGYLKHRILLVHLLTY